MPIIDSRVLIHEDSLLEMEIIPQSVHSIFGTLLKSFKYSPTHWTALGFWLGLYWNDGLEQLVNSMTRNDAIKIHQTVKGNRNLSATGKLVEKTADDEWDKEHIDEIQGKHYARK